MPFLFGHASLSQIITNISEIIKNNKDDIIVQLLVLSIAYLGFKCRRIIGNIFLFLIKHLRKRSIRDYKVDENGKKFIRLLNHNLKKFKIPRGVTSIDSWAFENCSSLSSVKIPSSVESIGVAAFRDCTSLTSVTIPSSVTSIGDKAFWGCSSLTSIEVDKNNPNYCSIDGVLFTKDQKTLIFCPLGKKAFSIPSGFTSIGDKAFWGCSSLSSVEIPPSVTSIGKGAFEGCSSLSSLVIPEGVTRIEDHTFRRCSSLMSLAIPSSVTSIGTGFGDSAFKDFSFLSSIKIPSSVTSIRFWGFGVMNSIGYRAFEGCSSLTKIEVAADNPNYCSIDGALFTKDKKTLLAYPAGRKGKYTLPDSVTGIGDGAFNGCSSLDSLEIPICLTDIGRNAFEGCSSLKSFEIPDCVSEIRYHTFFGCSFLKLIVIPDSVTEIGWNAFEGCSSLKLVYIPPSVTKIGDNAFKGCSSLSSLIISSSVTSIGAGAFYGCPNLTLKGPKGSYAEQYAKENGIKYVIY